MTSPTLMWPNLPTFGDRLRYVRIFVAGYKKNSEAMADRLGVRRSTYATWENGARPRDKVDVTARVCHEFPDVPRDWLLFAQLSSKLRTAVNFRTLPASTPRNRLSRRRQTA